MSDDLDLGDMEKDPFDDFLSDIDDGGFDDPMESPKGGPVKKVLYGAKTGVTDTVTNPGKLASMAVDNAMPKEVTNIVKPVIRAKDDLGAAIREKSKTFRSEIQPIVKKIDSVVPESGFTRNIFDKVKSALDADYEHSSSSTSIEEAARLQAAEVFGNQEEDKVRQVLSQAVQYDAAVSSLDLQKDTLKHVSILSNYTTQITSNYQRKSLELRYRMAAMMKQYMEKFNTYASGTKRQLEAVVNNTSLPDFAKLKSTKALVQQMRADINKRVVDRLYGNSNFMDNVISNLGNKIGYTLDAVGGAVGMVSGAGDMVDPEMMDAKEMFGNMLGEGAVALGMKGARGKISAAAKRRNGMLSRLRFIGEGGLPDFLEEVSRGKDQGNFVTRNVKGLAGWLANLGRPANKELRMDTVNALTPEQIRNYDVRSKISLVEVIPGYLSRILREVTFLSRGEDTDLLKYSYTSRAFVGQEKITKFVKSELESAAGYTGLTGGLDEATKLLEEKAGPIDRELKAKLRKALIKNATEGDAVGIGLLNSRGFFDNFSEEEIPLVKDIISTYMRESEDKYDAKLAFKEAMENIRSQVPDVTNVLSDTIDRGSSDSLMELGVLKPTMDGKVTIDKDAVYEILARNGIKEPEVNLTAKEELEQKIADKITGYKKKVTDKLSGIAGGVMNRFKKPETEEDTEGEAESQIDTNVSPGGMSDALTRNVASRLKDVDVKKVKDTTKGIVDKYVPGVVKSTFSKLYGKDSLLRKGIRKTGNVAAGAVDRTFKLENRIKNRVRKTFGKKQVKFKGPRLKARLRRLSGRVSRFAKGLTSGDALNMSMISTIENEFATISELVNKDEDTTPADTFSIETAKNTAISTLALEGISGKLDGLLKTKEGKPKRFEDELAKLKQRAKDKKERIKERLSRSNDKDGKDKGSKTNMITTLLGSMKSVVSSGFGTVTDMLYNLLEGLGIAYAGKKAMDFGFGSGEGKDGKRTPKKPKKTSLRNRFSRRFKGGKRIMSSLKGLGAKALGIGGSLVGLMGTSELYDSIKDKFAKKATEKAAEKASVKAAEKTALKTGGKALGKSFLKKVPVLGALAGLGFAASRLSDGDYKGAGLEVLSGLAGGSGLGFLASIGIDGYLTKRDMDMEVDKNVEAIMPSIKKTLETIHAKETIDPAKVTKMLTNIAKAIMSAGEDDVEDVSETLTKVLKDVFKKSDADFKVIAEYAANRAKVENETGNVTPIVSPVVLEEVSLLTSEKPPTKDSDVKKLKEKISGKGIKPTSKRFSDRNKNKLYENQRTSSRKDAFTSMPMDGDSEPRDLDRTSKPASFTGSVKGVPLAGGDVKDPDYGESYVVANGANIEGLNPAVKDLLYGMAKEYYELTGKTISVNSAKRSTSEQMKLARKAGNKAAAPGRSLHEYGLALDINTATANELDKLGLMRKYGFTRPLQGESWHLEPAMVQLYLDEARRDSDFATKLAVMSIGKGGSGLGAITPKGKKPIRRDLTFAKKLIDDTVSEKPTNVINDGLTVPVSNKTVRKQGKLPVLMGDYIPAKEVTAPKPTVKNVALSKAQETRVPEVNGEIVNREVPGMSNVLKNVDYTLRESLDVQKQILTALLQLKDLKSKESKVTPQQQAPSAPQSTTIPEPAVSMARARRI